jgi:hypothetical protein
MNTVTIQSVTIGLAHRKILAAMERLQKRVPNKGMNFLQIGTEAGDYSYTHSRRLIMDLVAVGKVEWVPGVANSIRLPAPKPPAGPADEDWA